MRRRRRRRMTTMGPYRRGFTLEIKWSRFIRFYLRWIKHHDKLKLITII